ncbi:MAG: hypothetical protein RLY43_2042 [Bacteroidota bacterium]|jgi:hypothetical protein
MKPDYFNLINGKVAEYFDFAAMGNLRAVRDITAELEEIVKSSVAHGYGIAEYTRDIEAAAGCPVPEDDGFYKSIVKLFELHTNKKSVAWNT